YPAVCGQVNGFMIRNGDQAKATVNGNTINVYVNGTLRAAVVDNTFTSGNPGIGYNYGCAGTYADFAWTNFSATGAQVSSSSAAPQTPETIAAAVGKQGCVSIDQSSVKVCAYDYTVDGRAVEALLFRPSGAKTHPGVLMIPGYQRTAVNLIPMGVRLAA